MGNFVMGLLLLSTSIWIFVEVFKRKKKVQGYVWASQIRNLGGAFLLFIMAVTIFVSNKPLVQLINNLFEQK